MDNTRKGSKGVTSISHARVTIAPCDVHNRKEKTMTTTTPAVISVQLKDKLASIGDDVNLGSLEILLIIASQNLTQDVMKATFKAQPLAGSGFTEKNARFIKSASIIYTARKDEVNADLTFKSLVSLVRSYEEGTSDEITSPLGAEGALEILLNTSNTLADLAKADVKPIRTSTARTGGAGKADPKAPVILTADNFRASVMLFATSTDKVTRAKLIATLTALEVEVAKLDEVIAKAGKMTITASKSGKVTASK